MAIAKPHNHLQTVIFVIAQFILIMYMFETFKQALLKTTIITTPI